MIVPCFITKNDTQPYYRITAVDFKGNAVNLSNATIYCTMKNINTGALKLNRVTAGVTITASASGEFEYRWQSGDTDTVGTYGIEFEINPAAGGKYTIPNPIDGRGLVIIKESLDAS